MGAANGAMRASQQIDDRVGCNQRHVRVPHSPVIAEAGECNSIGEKFYFLAARTGFADHHKWRCGATNVGRWAPGRNAGAPRNVFQFKPVGIVMLFPHVLAC